MINKTNNRIYFIAWDIKETYTLDKDVIPINLSWDMSLQEMLELVRNELKYIKDEDIVIGHSLGATMAILGATRGNLKLYSVSPCFKEAKHLLNEDEIKFLGNKYNEIDKLSIKDVKLKPVCYIGEKEDKKMYDVKLKPVCYIGEKEDKKMYKALEEIKSLGLIKSYIIPNANHGDVINHSGKIKYDNNKWRLNKRIKETRGQ